MTGVRAVAQRARRLLFSVGDTELLLQVDPDRRPERIRLFGQMLDGGEPVEAAAVSLCGPKACADQDTDEDGEFRFLDLPKGHYGLDLMTTTRLIRVVSFDVD